MPDPLLPEEQLDQVLEHASFVQQLGVAGAPGAAWAIAEAAPLLVRELRDHRATQEACDAELVRLKARIAELEARS